MHRSTWAAYFCTLLRSPNSWMLATSTATTKPGVKLASYRRSSIYPYRLGIGSLQRMAAFFPRDFSARYSAPAHPMVSPSGFLWHRIRISWAERSRMTAVCRSTDSVITNLFSSGRVPLRYLPAGALGQPAAPAQGGSLPLRVTGIGFKAAQHLADVRGVGGAVILHKDVAGRLANVHPAADLGADMPAGLVQRLDHRRAAALASHHADVHLGHIQVGGDIQAGDGQQAVGDAGILHTADDGDEFPLHILGHAA